MTKGKVRFPSMRWKIVTASVVSFAFCLGPSGLKSLQRSKSLGSSFCGGCVACILEENEVSECGFSARALTLA